MSSHDHFGGDSVRRVSSTAEQDADVSNAGVQEAGFTGS